MEVNSQPTEGLITLSEGRVEIVKAWLTVQGEGPQSGVPAVFIRLAGCNLQCPFCDTDYTSSRKTYTPSEVVELVRGIRLSGLVVLTGGEPVRQNIGPMITALLEDGYKIGIETNGTLFRSNIPWERITVVCSPKTPKIHPELMPFLDALKYVIDKDHVDPTDGLSSQILGGLPAAKPPPPLVQFNRLVMTGKPVPIYIQPMDEQDPERNREHVEAALKVCYQWDYILCLQTQKLIGLE
jgi:organic radical activating enzyme